MRIIGAGLSGLLCGALNHGSTIYEAHAGLPNNHGAILRFRSDAIGKALGIPFKKVSVHKAVWNHGYVANDPRVQNQYSRKVTGAYLSRSIANIDMVERYIAPSDFIQQLADRCNIVYSRPFPECFGASIGEIPTVSTIPMQAMMRTLNIPMREGDVAFKMSTIYTKTFQIANADLYQTIYYPALDCDVYRASFTGDKLICEYVCEPKSDNRDVIFHSFGLSPDMEFTVAAEFREQKYGKIVPINNDQRRVIMGKMTHEYAIYSLGRYATWRNILLDDVFEDIFKIRDLMRLDHYALKLALSEEK
jgi:hypothetical protein